MMINSLITHSGPMSSDLVIVYILVVLLHNSLMIICSHVALTYTCILFLSNQVFFLQENQLVQMQTRTISPPMYFHEGKLSSSMAAESPVAMSAMSLSALSANQVR